MSVFACLPLRGETLTSVAEANRINLEDITSPRPFDFTGTVLSTADRRFLIFSDGSDGAHIFPEGIVPSGLRTWDVIRTRGEMVVVDYDKTRRFVSHEIEILGHKTPTVPVAAPASEINKGNYDFSFVRIRGVITSCVLDEVAPDYCWMAFRTDTDKVFLAISMDALRKCPLTELVDAEAEITGLAAPISGLRRRLGRSLLVHDPDGITILKPPPKDPFGAEPLSETANALHRQRISGDVIAASRNRFFLRTDIGRIISVTPVPNTSVPKIGKRVDVAGFPEYVHYWLCLSDAVIRTIGDTTRPLDTPKALAMADLFTDMKGRRSFKTQQTGHRLTLRGEVAASTENEIEITDGENAVSVIIDAVCDGLCEIPKPGSMVEVTGLCWTEFRQNPESDIYPVFQRFTLYPYDASDLRVIAAPPWWTSARLLMLISVLTVLLAGSFIWNVTLNKKAEKRGRELYEERAHHAIAEKKVEERTRLAVELHDSISQMLTGIAMQLEVGNTDTAKTMLSACRSDLRRCLWDLRSRTFEEKDMTEAIERTLEPHSFGAKISVRFNVPRERLSDSTTHAILHIVRELVVNAIRHGKATEIKIAGECHDDTISFSVSDNGCGFDPKAAPGPEDGHFGLQGIRERLKEFAGKMNMESAASIGMKASVSMKLSHQS